MDWLYLNLLLSIQTFLTWCPWLDFFTDSFFLQFIILYTAYLIYSTNNLYFVLFYLFLEIFYIGVFLSVYNLELFTAFLWLTECVIIFISILFLFYLNVYGNINKINFNIYSFKYFGIYFGFFLFSSLISFSHEYEDSGFLDLNLYLYWDDYYEALSNFRLNDTFGLYISYYIINSFEFILIGVLLLLGSVVCVNLNKFSKDFKSFNYYDLLTLFDFFDDFIKFFFLRKQNLVDQENHIPATKMYKKKVKK